MYFYISIITGAVTTPSLNQRTCLTYFYLFKQKFVTSLKLTDLIDTLQLLIRIKDDYRIF